jgi:hypothetical protein
MREPMFMILGMYIMEPEPISTAYFINTSHQSVCLYVYRSMVARQRLSKKRYRGNEYTHNNRRIVGDVDIYAVRVVSKESGLLVLLRTLVHSIREFKICLMFYSERI